MWYLLAQEDYPKFYDDMGTRDKAIHDYFQNIWYDRVGSNIGISGNWHSGDIKNDQEANAFIGRAKKYAGIDGSGASAISGAFSANDEPKIECNQSSINYDNGNDTYLDRIDVYYTGEIESITAIDAAGKTISGIKIYDCINEKEISDFSKIGIWPSFRGNESSFKIKKDNNASRINRIIVKLKGKTVNTADLWFIETANGKASQRLVIVEDGQEFINPQVEIQVKQPNKTGSLTIIKKDANSKVGLKDAGFKIYKVGENGGWLYGTKKGYSYKDNEKDASKYKTDSEGNLKLEDLSFGTYKVYEVEAPNGYNLEDQDYYQANNEYIKKAVLCKKDGSSAIVINSSNKNQELVVFNRKQKQPEDGSLTIIKKDVNDSTKVLTAGFKIRNADGEWLRGTNNNFTFVPNATGNPSDPSVASTYRTSDNRFKTSEGYLKLEGLPYDTYVVYEVEAPNGYNLEDQDYYQANNQYIDNAVVCKKDGSSSIVIDSSHKRQTLEVYNRTKKEDGSLTIMKKDANDSTKVLTAGFKIRNADGKWLRGSQKNFTFVDYPSEEAAKEAAEIDSNVIVRNNYASTYKATMDGFGTSEGYLKLEGLPYDTYIVYEVEAPSGYELENQENYQEKNKYINKVVICKKNNSSNIVINSSNKAQTLEVFNRRGVGSLTIIKKDAEDSTKVLAAGFKIRTLEGKWLRGRTFWRI